MIKAIENKQSTEKSNSEASSISIGSINRVLGLLKPANSDYATKFVDKLIEFAVESGISDLHLQPNKDKFAIKFRFNGVLEDLEEFSLGESTSIVSRIKVLSDLTTYLTDTPQEGRILDTSSGTEIRVSTFPTLHGERVALRFFGNGKKFTKLKELGHSRQIVDSLESTLAETSGAMLVTGPAGSGKSTTLFACMRHLVEQENGQRCLMTLEDPIEVPIDGVSQSQVSKTNGFDMKVGLKSLLRQDPEVIMIGEIRDSETAELAMQACLTGQLMLTTFHSDNVATAISRLIDLGVAPYLIKSGVKGILNQRLLRCLCDHCKVSTNDPSKLMGLDIDEAAIPVGCPSCNYTGFTNRIVASEFLCLKEGTLVNDLLESRDSRRIYKVAIESGMESLWDNAMELLKAQKTSVCEVLRVLGSKPQV